MSVDQVDHSTGDLMDMAPSVSNLFGADVLGCNVSQLYLRLTLGVKPNPKRLVCGIQILGFLSFLILYFKLIKLEITKKNSTEKLIK